MIWNVDSEDMRQVLAIANAAVAHHAAQGTTHRSKPSDSQLRINVLGFAAEMAFHRLFPGLEWHNETGVTKTRDGHKLAEFGSDIDVKASTRGNRLIVGKTEESAYRYPLAWVELDPSFKRAGVEFVGWAHGSTVKQPENWKPHLPVPAFMLSVDRLEPMETLLWEEGA